MLLVLVSRTRYVVVVGKRSRILSLSLLIEAKERKEEAFHKDGCHQEEAGNDWDLQRRHMNMNMIWTPHFKLE